MVLVRTAVFLRSLTWHHVLTSLMFRPDGEPCRVKSLSPRAAAHFFASFVIFYRLVRFPSVFYA
jgi:hypothetical protein